VTIYKPAAYPWLCL